MTLALKKANVDILKSEERHRKQVTSSALKLTQTQDAANLHILQVDFCWLLQFFNDGQLGCTELSKR